MNIVITGASSGIGFEAALHLATHAKHQVLALARSKENLRKLQETVNSTNSGISLSTSVYDIVNSDFKTLLLPILQNRFGSVDILINNAGSLINKSFQETGYPDFVSMLESNFLGHVRMIKDLLPLMNEGGHIVNIGSMGGFQGSVKFPGLAAYSASKAALHTFTECLALELQPSKIKVNCLALGSAQTEMLSKAFPEYQSPVNAADMGRFVADFAIQGHKFFNGKVLPVSISTP